MLDNGVWFYEGAIGGILSRVNRTETYEQKKLPIFRTNIVAVQFSSKYNVLGFRTLNILHLSIQVKYSILCIHKCECIYADFVLFLHYPS